MKVEELKEEILSGKGHTEMVEQYYTVRQIFLLCPELGVVDVCMDTNRQIQLCRPSYAYSVEGPVVPFARQTSLTPSPLKIGDHSVSISMSVSPTFLPVLVTNLQFLRAARFSTHHSRRAYTFLGASTRVGRPIRLERGDPTGANRVVSDNSCPPS